MDIWELDKLLLFIAFVMPGFISIKAYQLIFPGKERLTSDQLIDAIAYSCINYSILIIPIISVESGGLKESCPFLYYSFYLIVLLIAPIVWVLLWKYLRTREFFLRNAPHPTSRTWDFLFSQRKPYWAKVILKNGTIIGGLYSTKSNASSAPSPEQIYLEQTWIIDANGAFVRKKNETEGVLILSDEISHIELRTYSE